MIFLGYKTWFSPDAISIRWFGQLTVEMNFVVVLTLVVAVVLAGQPEKELAKTLILRNVNTGLIGRPVDKV